MSQVLARKWRPKDFASVIGQEHVVRALTNALTQQRLHHAYLFTGTRGVGKTTIARILAKCFNCETGVTATPCGTCDACVEIDGARFVDLTEVDAASRTKVEDTRDLLNNVQYLPVNARYKIYLIDEVHMLSGHSFNALLKTLEEPPAHVKFLFATTDPQKLPVTVLSRCLQFNLKKLSPSYIQQQLSKVLRAENVAYEDAALLRLASAADGSVRDALSLLDQAIAYGAGAVKIADVCNMLGTVDKAYILQLLVGVADNSVNAVLQFVAELEAQAKDFNGVLEELLGCLHQIAVLQMLQLSPAGTGASVGVGVGADAGANAGAGVGNRAVESLLVNYAPEHQTILQQLAQHFDPEEVQLYYQIALIGKRDLPLAPTAHSGFEMLMLRMLAFRPQSLTAAAATVATVATANESTTATAARGMPTHAPISAAPAETGISNADIINKTAAIVADTSPQVFNPRSFMNTQDLLQHLKVSGLTAALLQHCALVSATDDEIVFLLHQSHALMLNKSHEERLRVALSELFGKPMHVVINVGTNDAIVGAAPTPAALQEQRKMALLQDLEQSPKLKKILTTFDAAIIPESIKIVE